MHLSEEHGPFSIAVFKRQLPGGLVDDIIRERKVRAVDMQSASQCRPNRGDSPFLAQLSGGRQLVVS